MLALFLTVPMIMWPPKGLKIDVFDNHTIVLRFLSRKPCEYPHKPYVIRN